MFLIFDWSDRRRRVGIASISFTPACTRPNLNSLHNGTIESLNPLASVSVTVILVYISNRSCRDWAGTNTGVPNPLVPNVSGSFRPSLACLIDRLNNCFCEGAWDVLTSLILLSTNISWYTALFWTIFLWLNFSPFSPNGSPCNCPTTCLKSGTSFPTAAKSASWAAAFLPSAPVTS